MNNENTNKDIKFMDVVEGRVEVTTEQMREITEKELFDVNNIKDLNDILSRLHGSDAHYAIVNMIKPSTNIIIQSAKKDNDVEYQRFQDIMMSAKETFDYENTVVKRGEMILNINKTIQRVNQMYGVLVKMISVLDDEIGEVEMAINRIEQHLGLDVTKFNDEKGDAQDDTEQSNNE